MKKSLHLFIIMIAAILTACSNGACNTNSPIPTPTPPAVPSVDLDSNNGGVSNGESNVSLTPSIVLQFSVPMDPSTINAQTVTLTTNSFTAHKLTDIGQSIAITAITASANNTIFTFSSESPLSPGQMYNVNVNNTLTATGLPVSGTFNFTTGTVQFVAVGTNGTILYSLDGTQWESTVFDSTFINSVNYAESQFVAVGENGTIYTSYNGVNWASQTSTTTQELFDTAYGSGLFVTIGCEGTVLTSSNGYDWADHSDYNDKFFCSDLYGIAYGNGIFVTVGEDFSSGNHNGVLASTTNPNTPESWTRLTDPSSSTELDAVTYGGEKFVAVGANGAIIYASKTADDWVTAASSGVVTTAQIGAITYANGLFVAATRDGGIIKSSDANNWNAVISGTTSILYSITHGNNKFIAVGESGTIISSVAGESWITIPAITIESLYGVTSRH